MAAQIFRRGRIQYGEYIMATRNTGGSQCCVQPYFEGGNDHIGTSDRVAVRSDVIGREIPVGPPIRDDYIAPVSAGYDESDCCGRGLGVQHILVVHALFPQQLQKSLPVTVPADFSKETHICAKPGGSYRHIGPFPTVRFMVVPSNHRFLGDRKSVRVHHKGDHIAPYNRYGSHVLT